MMPKTSMLLLLTLATILALSVRCSFGYPKRLKKASAQGQSPIQSQSASPDRDEFRDVKRPTAMPCVDELDRYSCFYDIVMLDACITNEFEMWQYCRYSCNFC